MKNKDLIIIRSVILLALSDRCAMEKSVIGGQRRSLSEREAQRCAILSWLKTRDYYDHVLPSERGVFEKRVTEKTDLEVLRVQMNYECIEPLLWSLSLVDELSNYDGFVLNDFHSTLQFGKNHSLKNLLDNTSLRSLSEIEEKGRIAMFWYWRCLEQRKNQSKIDCYSFLAKRFGETEVCLLDKYCSFDRNENDFIVNGRPVSELSDAEFARLETITEKRLYAFEWLLSDETWDHISLIA